VSPMLTVCDRHKVLIPDGEKCPSCAKSGQARRQRRNRDLGRSSSHWRKLSARLILMVRRELGGRCPGCGGTERSGDPGSKLTCDLIAGGDHARAVERDCRVRCRRCHGRAQGGRPKAKAAV